MPFRFLYIFILSNLFLFSCVENKEEVIDLSDIITESENYKEGVEKEKVNEIVEDSTLAVVEYFISNGVEVDKIHFLTKNKFPDRFSPNRKDKFEIVNGLDTLQYFNWSYTDSAKTMNAFFNWIDNFGEKGSSIRVGEKKRLQKKGFVMYVGDTNLIFIQSNNSVNEKEWDYFFEKQRFVKWNYYLAQKKNSKVKWFTLLDGEREKINYID